MQVLASLLSFHSDACAVNASDGALRSQQTLPLRADLDSFSFLRRLDKDVRSRSHPCAAPCASLRIKMQKGIRLNDGHVTYLGLLAKKDGTRRGCLSKKSSDNTKWHTKWFALLQNMLFYFENESSSRPSGLYLLEGCICDRAPSPKPSQSAKECLEKQVHTGAHSHTRTLLKHNPGATIRILHLNSACVCVCFFFSCKFSFLFLPPRLVA